MTYFCKAHCMSSKDKEVTTYIVFDENQELFLKEEQLKENNQFREFVDSNRKIKTVFVDYKVYCTDEKVFGSTSAEDFEIIIEQSSTFYSEAELTVELKKKNPKKKNKLTFKQVLTYISCLLIAVGGGLGGGYLLFHTKEVPDDIETINIISEDGMFIPEQIQIENAEQITVSIDRSYSAVPTDDLELKGSVVDGKAAITLPEFDKTDYFTHVAGYTYGFSSNPDGEKIEYYGGNTYEFTTDKKLYRVLVKYGGGSGTKEDPYLINYYDQLELMASEQTRGYYKQTEDIVFPSYASHTPIDTVNELKSKPNAEYFEYDGGGYVIDNIDAPLFGNVSGATIKNVNIRSGVIKSEIYRDYGAIVCNAYNYQYKTDKADYKTGETLIKHCSVSHTSITIETAKEETTTANTEPQPVTEMVVVPPDLIEYDENGKVIEHEIPTSTTVTPKTKTGEYSIGAISGNGGQIEDCYVTDFGVFINSDDYILNVGGISGKPSNVANCTVYDYSAQGNIFNTGGIVGSASGSRLYDAQGNELPDCYGGNIQGCNARKILFSCELSAGGIAGVSGSNAENAIISNCYAHEFNITCGEYSDGPERQLIKAGIIGGIIGCDSNSKFGHTVSNTVSMPDIPVIGKADKSKFDETVRQAPDFAYFQENILTVINKNTISPENPKEIFTGIFKFGSAEIYGDINNGGLSYPESIEDLFEKTIIGGNNNG